MFTSFVTAFLVIIMTQLIWESLFPFPAGLDTTQEESVMYWMSTLPSKAYIIIGLSHVLAIFLSGFISALVAGSSRMTVGVITVFCVFIFIVTYLFTYDLPTWFVVTDTALSAIGGFAGVILGSQRMMS